jgi:hypothetical protein
MHADLNALGRPHHTGYVVDDIAATVDLLVERFGAGPFLLIEDVPLENVTSAGEPAVFAHDSAFGSLGGYPIELQQVARAEPARVREKWAPPRPRVQHVGYALEPAAAEDVRAAYEQRGLPEYLRSDLNGETTTVHNAAAVLGHDVEILVDGPPLREFFGAVLAAAEGWDGSDPLRAVT